MEERKGIDQDEEDGSWRQITRWKTEITCSS